jgi:hypothetical protein
MLNGVTYLSGLLIVFFAFSACEKVIEIDLSGSKEAIVIEAKITNTKMPFTVKVSKTLPYFGTKTSNPVSGAKVSVRAEKGKPRYFVEKSPGLYELANISAIAGFWYIVDVEYEGVTYTARSFMNDVVPIVEVGFSYFDGLGFFDSGYKVNTYIRDPANTKNFYRLKYFVNGEATDNQREITLYSDQLFDGQNIGLGQRSVVFQEADTLIIELQSIDEAAYDYFSTLESISGDVIEQSASPANPNSNFNNGALGYFSAYTFDRKTVIIKDYIQN